MKIYVYKGRKNLCGNRVKEARARLKITQEDLAARLQVEGITMERDSVSRIEIGTRFVTEQAVCDRMADRAERKINTCVSMKQML